MVDPGACSHKKILKSTILEMAFLALCGLNFTLSEGCEVRFSRRLLSKLNEWEKAHLRLKFNQSGYIIYLYKFY